MAVTRPRMAVARPEAVVNRSTIGAGMRVEPRVRVRLVYERVRHDRTGPIRERLRDARDSWIADVRDERGAGGRPPDPAFECRTDIRRVPKHVWVIPLGAGQDRDVGMVGIEVARVLVRLHDEGGSCAEASR